MLLNVSVFSFMTYRSSGKGTARDILFFWPFWTGVSKEPLRVFEGKSFDYLSKIFVMLPLSN